MELKDSLRHYTEYQFKMFIKAIEDAETENQQAELIVHFNKIVPHPAGSDLLFYPEPGADDSAEGVVKEIQKWCLDNGIPGLRPSL